MTTPNAEILPDDKELDDTGKLLIQFSDAIREVLNFGTHVLSWEINEAKGSDENIPIGMMLRNILEILDAVSILVGKSSIDPCKPLLRGILETLFGLEYIVQNETKQRALNFLVWHFHKELKLSNKLNPKQQEHKQLVTKFQNDKSTAADSKPPTIENIDKHQENLKAILRLPIYAESEAEYQRLKAAGTKDPKWYHFHSGPNNIEELSKHLKRDAIYEVLYRGWSNSVHGTDIIQGKLFSSSGNAEIVQIRYVKDAQTVTQMAMTLGLMTYQVLIEHRLKGYKVDYTKWYLTIRDLYLQLTTEKLIVI